MTKLAIALFLTIITIASVNVVTAKPPATRIDVTGNFKLVVAEPSGLANRWRSCSVSTIANNQLTLYCQR
jgi:hypothetical protein